MQMFNLVSVFLVLMSVWLIFQKQNTVSRIIMQKKKSEENYRAQTAANLWQ